MGLKVFIQDRIFFLSFSKEERTLWVCCCPSLYSRYSLVTGCFVTVVLFLFSCWFSKCFCGTTVPPRSFLVSPAYSQRLQWFPCRNWFGGPPRCMKSCALWAYVGHDLEDMTAHQETSPAHRLLMESLFFWSEDCCVEEAVSSATWPRGTLALSPGILLSIRSPGEADGCLPPLSEHRIWRAKSCSAETNASSGIRCALLCMVLYKGRLTHNRLYQRAVPPPLRLEAEMLTLSGLKCVDFSLV